MNDKEIVTLQKLIKDRVQLAYNPDSTTCFPVIHIGTHAEENDDEFCAIFANGKYAALYNCSLSDFVIFSRLA